MNSNVFSFKDYHENGGNDNVRLDEKEGSLEIINEDGSAVVVFEPEGSSRRYDDDHYENLAVHLGESELGLISSQLLQGIEADEQSRSEWLSTRARGIDLLGLKIEQPRSDVGGSGAPMDGMSTVRHPLLLEACLRFQANAMGELLPANGPVKVKNVGLGTAMNDTQADQLEEDMNRYLTSTDGAPEYYPDTDRMLFGVGFSGMGFKKLYHCPLRRRPVSESVDAKDLIVSNDATDIRNAARVTHRIQMRKSVMARMQYVGAYRKVVLGQPTTDINRVDQKIKKIQGIDAQPQRPEDNEYTVFECYADIDIPGFEHIDEDGETTGLPLPYKVSIDKTSRKILEIRRNWNVDDEDFKARRVFVPYQFVPMFGFYASGLLQILGNTTTAITGAWRLLLDSGMFSNFPGFLYALNGDRQNDLNFRVPPGGGAGVDIAGADDIRQKVMALPYKEPGPSTMALVQNIAETGQRVGGIAEIQVGEGRQDAPVGSTIAMIEQAAKVLNAVHKRLHQAQSEEFQILLELFREDPEAFFRFVKRDGNWTEDTLRAALENYDLIPVADPNVPTHMHRLMKMQALKQMADAAPDRYNLKAVDERILRALNIDDPETLFATPEQMQAASAPPADPASIIAQATAQTKQAEIASRERIEQQKSQLKIAEISNKDRQNSEANRVKLEQIAADDKRASQDRESREYVEKMKLAERLASKDIDNEMRQAERVYDQANKKVS